MKTHNVNQTIGAVALIGALIMPGFVFASSVSGVQPVYDSQVDADVKQVDADVNTGFGTANQNLGQIQQSALGVLNFMQKNSTDGSTYQGLDQISAKYVQALINYDAAARLNEYQYNQELLFMAAPGSVWAVKAGGLIGLSNVSTKALTLANTSLLTAVAPFSNATSFTGTLAGTTSVSVTPVDKIALYNTNIAPFVTSGNTTGLTIINPGQFLQSNNLVKSQLDTQSQQMINILTNPPAITDPNLLKEVQLGATGAAGPDGGGKELIVDTLSDYAIIAVSMNALGDIVSRRTPGTDINGNQLTSSVMEVMDQYSGQRFTNKDWYTQMSTASDSALLREIAHIQAYTAWVQYQQFRVQEQQMALLATMNAVLAKMNVGMDKLDVQLQQAQAQASKAASDYKTAASKCTSKQYADANGNCVDIPTSTPASSP